MLKPDRNPIIDEGETTSTGAIINAIEVCDGLGIHFCIDPPWRAYFRIWRPTGENNRTVIGKLYLPFCDVRGKRTSTPIDLFEEESSVIKVLGLKRMLIL